MFRSSCAEKCRILNAKRLESEKNEALSGRYFGLWKAHNNQQRVKAIIGPVISEMWENPYDRKKTNVIVGPIIAEAFAKFTKPK